MYDVKAFVYGYDNQRKVMKRHFIALNKDPLTYQEAKERCGALRKWKPRIVKRSAVAAAQEAPADA